MKKEIFRDYDIRGKYGDDFSAEDFYFIAQAYASFLKPRIVAVGYDVRESSPELARQAVDGLIDAGVDVLNIGPISTDMLYFAVANYRADGGIIISASHNPLEYNGMKMVREQAIPISGDTGITEIGDISLQMKEKGEKITSRKRGLVRSSALLDDYVLHIQSFVNMNKIRHKKIVINANRGYAGVVVKKLLEGTDVEICRELFTEPNGRFEGVPAGRPDPLRPENRKLTVKAVEETGADFAVAWDADADRCFFFDEKGEFVEGCYITALLARLFLERYPGGKIIYDPRIRWPIEEVVPKAQTVVNRCGHSLIKQRMRDDDAVFGGEASAHYYFRRNFYADNGMVPFLMLLEYLCSHPQLKLSEWVDTLRSRHPVSGEINFRFEQVSMIPAAIETLKGKLKELSSSPAQEEEPIDGYSAAFVENPNLRWRFNIRESRTEPLLRLNLEVECSEHSQGESLLKEKTEKFAELLLSLGAERETRFYWEE